MNYKEVIGKVSEDLNIPEKEVDRIYKAYWMFIKKTIQSLPLKENLSKEDFAKLRTNFNIPSLGKLNCTYERMINIKKKYNILKEKNKENAESKKD